MMDPAYKSNFEALSVCSLQWFLRKPDLSGFTGLEKSVHAHLLALSSLSQTSSASSTATCNLTMGFLAEISWFHFKGLGRKMGFSFCCAIRMHNSKCVLLLHHCETFYGATLSGDCRLNERYREAWENQRLKGLKFPSAMSLLFFFPQGKSKPVGFFQGLHLTIRITGILFSLQWVNGNHSMNLWLITTNQQLMARILTMEYTSNAFVINLQGWFFKGGKRKKVLPKMCWVFSNNEYIRGNFDFAQGPSASRERD